MAGSVPDALVHHVVQGLDIPTDNTMGVNEAVETKGGRVALRGAHDPADMLSGDVADAPIFGATGGMWDGWTPIELNANSAGPAQTQVTLCKLDLALQHSDPS